MKHVLPFLCLAFVVCSCEGAALLDAEQKNTPEAYEAFLAEHPDWPDAAELQVRVEELRYKRAKESRNPEMLREYMAKHPDGKHAVEVRRVEDELSWSAANGTKSGDAYRSYIELHPEGAWIEEARAAYEPFEYIPKLTLGEPSIRRVNMAEDPTGPLNGWGLDAPVTNTGDRKLKMVKMGIDYLGASGDVVKSDTWWLVAQDLGFLPVLPDMVPIMQPAETRTFRWSTAETPAGWAEGRFAVRVTGLGFAEEEAAEVKP